MAKLNAIICLSLQDQKDLQEQQDLPELQDSLDIMVFQVQQVLLERLVHLVQWDHQALNQDLEDQDLQVLKGYLDVQAQ